MHRARVWFLSLVLGTALPASAQGRIEIPARGVNVHSAIGAELDAVPLMHLNWVRMDLFWSAVETTDGRFSWGDIDRQVQASVSRGLRIYANVTSTPAWACRDGDPVGAGACVPRDGLFPRFVRAVATRYRGAIGVYGIWNEPDQPDFWHGDGLSYVDALLVPAATVIREVDPSARVAAPELSGSWGSSVRAPEAFFDAIGARQAGALVDLVSQHLYEERFLTGPDGLEKKFFDGDYFHHGLIHPIDLSVLSTKEIWITEFGFSGGGDSGNGSDVMRMFDLFGPEPRVTGLFDYELVDCSSCASPGDSGLLRSDFTWKPGATLLLQKLGETEPHPPLFLDHFSGAWSAAFFRWVFPRGGAALVNGRLGNTVPDFVAKIGDARVTDFEISSLVWLEDGPGNSQGFVGLVGRTTAIADGGEQNGYRALLRANGDAELDSPSIGLLRVVSTGLSSRFLPVKLTLTGKGDRISVSVNDVELLVVHDGFFAEGWAGVQNRGIGFHDDVILKSATSEVAPPVPRLSHPVPPVEPMPGPGVPNGPVR